MSEQIIIDGVKNGDNGQFNVLVNRYRDRIYRYLVKRLDDPCVAEDLTQEAFITAYKKLDTFKQNSKFSTWLFGIALNISRNHLNRSPRRPFQDVHQEENNNSNENGKGLLEDLIQQESLLSLKEKIDELGEDLRDTIILVFFESFSYEETAVIMDIPIGTVKSRIYRARKVLRETMK